LDHEPTFDDLKVAMPELGRGLQQLLDYDGDVENVFMRSFDVCLRPAAYYLVFIVITDTT
jgi:hypothetical protein